jgi:hypothetical protein
MDISEYLCGCCLSDKLFDDYFISKVNDTVSTKDHTKMFRRHYLLSAGAFYLFRGFASDRIPVSCLGPLLCSFYFPPPARDLLGEEVSGFPATKNVCFDFQMPREHDDGTQTLRHRNSDPIIILRVSPQTPLKLLTCNVRSFSSSRYVRRLESPLPHAVQKSHFSKTISKLIQA